MTDLEHRTRAGIGRRLASLAFLSVLTTGCSSSQSLRIYDLGDTSTRSRLLSEAPVMAVGEPFVLKLLDTDRALVRDIDGSISALAGVQWTDRVPALVQARLIRAFEENGRPAIRTGSGMSADYVVSSELTAFQVTSGESPTVDIQIGVKLVQSIDGKIIGVRTFRGQNAITTIDGASVRDGFASLLGDISDNVARWSASVP
ncbi:MAG: ABC-type transport auxiliary lipoprotein family protein [Hyphomicrobiales bacterium]